MPFASRRGASPRSILIAVAATAAVAGFLYVRWERRCCRPAPIVIPPSSSDARPSAEGRMPSDFAVQVASSNGSVAPPYHYDVEITVDSAGNGTLRYWPGYGEEANRQVTGRFTVDWTTRQRLWSVAMGLRDAPGRRPDSQIPVGGASSAITLRAYYASTFVEPWQPAPSSARSERLTAMLRAAVPDSIWSLTREAQRRVSDPSD